MAGRIGTARATAGRCDVGYWAVGLLAFGALLFGGISGAAAEEQQSQSQLQEAISLARDRVYPSLVNIGVVDRQFSQGRETRAIGAGSGVIVSPAGHVITNYHVAGTATRLTCRLPNGEAIDADIVCPDPLTDLCILKLRLEERRDPTQPLPFASIGDSSRLKVGDHVLALGNPLSLSSSVTLGIVSNPERVFTSFTGDSIQRMQLPTGDETGIFNFWIQHDALIQPGNSGGPLVNMRGEVIGINTRGGGGVGFAIPSTTCKKILNQALTFGEVRRGWMGMSVMPVRHLDREEGALVSSVLEDGPADKAGIKPGDVIVSLDDTPVAVTGFEDVPPFLSRIADFPSGRTVNVGVLRPGAGQGLQELHQLPVEVARMEKYQGDQRAFRIWGVSVQDITGPMAVLRGWDNTDGLRLRTLRPGGPPDAAKPPLRSGDVVLEVAGKPVNDLDTFGEVIRKNKRKKALAVRFRRGKADMITVLDMSKKPKRRGSAELPKAWLGVRTQVLTPKVAKALGVEGTKGFRVTWVLPGTEAEKAGIQAGDLLTAVDGDQLDASDLQDAELLRRRIEDMDIGAEAVISVIRGGETKEIKVTLQETPGTAADARTAEDEVLEYKVRELTFMDKVDRDLPLDQEGIIVAQVTNGGWASVAGLRVGDVVLKLQGEAVTTISAFKKAIKKLAKDKPKRVNLFVRRQRNTAFVFTQPDWDEQ